MKRPPAPSVYLHLFGQVMLDDLHNLQRRLAYEAASRDDGRITVLICEHEPIITLGRLGSRADIRIEPEELERRQIEVQYIARGGGTILHGPGQLGIYVIAPVARLRWSVGEYLRRLQSAIVDTVEQLGIRAEQRPGSHALWGRTGVLAAFGVSIRNGISQHGAVLNVNPELRLYRQVQAIPAETKGAMGSLLSERMAAGKMSNVRSTLVVSLAAALGCESSHVFTGHPLLPDSLTRELQSAA